MHARFSVVTLLLAALTGSALAAPKGIDASLLKKERRQVSSAVPSATASATDSFSTDSSSTDSLLSATATATSADSSPTTIVDGSGGNTTIAGDVITYCNAAGFCANVTVSTGLANGTNTVCSGAGCVTVNATTNPFNGSNPTGTDGVFNSTDSGFNSTDSGFNSTDSGFNSTDSGFNSTDSGFNSTDSGFNSTDSGFNSTDTNSTDSSFFTSTLASYAVTSTFALSDLSIATAAPTAITIRNGDGVVSVIPLPTDSADSVKVKRLIKELDSRGKDTSKLKKLFTKKSALLNRMN